MSSRAVLAGGHVEEILWNIFTYYSLMGNPRDPSRLNHTGLVKFCRDGKNVAKLFDFIEPTLIVMLGNRAQYW